MNSVPTMKAGLRLRPSQKKERSWRGFVAAAVLMLSGILSIALDVAPAPLGGVPETQFSADRALKHVEAISQAPHPVGSAEHAVVKNYIVSVLRQIGLAPQVQKSAAVDRWGGMSIPLENIIAEMKGSQPGKSVLLVAHYDSVSSAPGAADDGAAVGALLEAARIFKTLPQFRRDILFLFTDGEEPGLLGATGVVAKNPLARNVGVVLNFDARGSRGPVILFETSDQNAWLIDNVSKAASHPVANSLSYEIYKRLRNDTDFSVFKHAGYPGLNFAFIDGLVNYHTAGDNLQNLDRGSLQHHGDYAVELGTRFANSASLQPGRNNAIYFDVLGKTLVHYSYLTGTLLLIAAMILTAWIILQGFRRQSLRVANLIFSALVILAGIAASVLVSVALHGLLSRLAARYSPIQTSLVGHGGYYVTMVCAAGLVAAVFLNTWNVKRFGPVNAGVAALLIWSGLALCAGIWMQGASFLLVWPLLFTGLAWAVALYKPRYTDKLLLAAAVPAALILVPLAQKIFTAFSIGSTPIISTLLALFLALCIVPLGPDTMSRKPSLPMSLVAAGIALCAAGIAF